MTASERVVVVGGGIGGLVAALDFARHGRAVTLLERDPLPAAPDVEAAFDAGRRGAPQVHQTHAFLARLVVLLRERFPDVLEALHRQGCTTMSWVEHLGDPQPGDEDLSVMIMRRTTFEWVLRQAVRAEPGVVLRTGVTVTGCRARAGDIPEVTGVQLDDGSPVAGEMVVAATGRRGSVPEWLGRLGVAVPETVRESGLMYLSRWYRLPADFSRPTDPKLAGDLGFVKYLAVPGDAGTLSVTLAIRTEDGELRAALSDPDRFEEACRILPGPDQFFAFPLEPRGSVRPMGGLVNRIRRFVDDDGRPTVIGFHAIGDAHTCTNPLYGRGCSLAVVQAALLTDATHAHPADPEARAVAYEQASAREVEPWFEASVQMDKLGADPAGVTGLSAAPADPAAKAMAAVFVAAGTDPILGRAMARFWNLLATPADLMGDPAFLGRMAEVMADPDAYPTPPRVGPSRTDLLAALAA